MEDTSQGRLLAVGDIHGCLEQLKCLISRVKPRENDQFVFLGDYIDRGPDSRGFWIIFSSFATATRPRFF